MFDCFFYNQRTTYRSRSDINHRSKEVFNSQMFVSFAHNHFLNAESDSRFDFQTRRLSTLKGGNLFSVAIGEWFQTYVYVISTLVKKRTRWQFKMESDVHWTESRKQRTLFQKIQWADNNNQKRWRKKHNWVNCFLLPLITIICRYPVLLYT